MLAFDRGVDVRNQDQGEEDADQVGDGAGGEVFQWGWGFDHDSFLERLADGICSCKVGADKKKPVQACYLHWLKVVICD